MEKWTVILKGPNDLHFEVVEADTPASSDDGKSLEFLDKGFGLPLLLSICGSMRDHTLGSCDP
jgi:hypothetical protein